MDVAGLLKSARRRTAPVLPYPVPLTPVDVRTVKFKTRRWGRHLDVRSVDDLMGKISESIDPSSDDESRLSSTEIGDSFESLEPARWGQRGYDAVDVLLLITAAAETARRMESYAVVKQAEAVLAGPQGDAVPSECGPCDDVDALEAVDTKLVALSDGIIALRDLTRSRIDDMEREIEDIRRQANGRLH